MAKLGKLITDISINETVVTIVFECRDADTARELYDGLCRGCKEGRIELTNGGAAEAEEISVQ
jgi:hypothetical protein